jgi:ankyrin repeat protein
LLVELGADILQAANDGETPLHAAIERRNNDVSFYLVECLQSALAAYGKRDNIVHSQVSSPAEAGSFSSTSPTAAVVGA